jgi:hypothetical protein
MRVLRGDCRSAAQRHQGRVNLAAVLHCFGVTAREHTQHRVSGAKSFQGGRGTGTSWELDHHVRGRLRDQYAMRRPWMPDAGLCAPSRRKL